jgi:hypothetical protein
MEFLILLLVAGAVVWFGTSNRRVKSTNRQRNSNPKGGAHNNTSSGKLAFQAAGASPKTDSAGRVVVKIKGSSSGLSWGVNLSKLGQAQAKQLAGRVTEDEEISKTIKVRMRPDTNSQFKNSVLIETVDEKFIGWLLKDSSDEAISVMAQVESALVKSASELKGLDFTFEVSAKLEGYWNDESEDGKPDWYADVQELAVKVKIPAQVEVD